jgi:DNA polymerase-3 subunit beta
VKFQVSRDVITDALAWASRGLPVRSPNPLLTGLHLEASGDQLTLSGSDLDISTRVSIEAVIEQPGSVLVPGKLLADIVRSLPNSTVEFSVDGARANLKCGRSSFSLPTMPVAEYPNLPSLPESSGTVSASELAVAVSQVAIAASRDETLPSFTGIKVDVDGSTITLAATDRYRLAVKELDWSPVNTTINAHALIPAKYFADTAKLLATATNISLGLGSSSDGLVGIEATNRQTTGRMIAADFPKYQGLIPSESTSFARFSTAAMLESVKRVALVIEREAAIKISFTDGEVSITGGSGDQAEARESFECQFEGEDITIAFNPSYLQDGLSAIDSPIAVVAMTAPGKPAVFTGAADLDSPADESFKYLLMPIRQQ